MIAAALNPAAGAMTFVEYDGEILVGAASFRLTEDGVKIANIGSLRRGVGTKLFHRVLAQSDGRVWCQSDPDSCGFYEKMGMRRCETLADGRTIYRIG